MRAADRIRNYLLEKRTGLTVSPANFIPVILAGEEEAKEIMSGNILMRSMLTEEEKKQIVDRIPEDMRGKSGHETWQDGYILNYADFAAKGLSMLPLVFSGHQFKKLTRKQALLGEYAVIITEPAEFMRRVAGYYEAYHANQMMIEAASAQYKDVVLDPEKYDVYARNARDRWKREILILARIKPGVVLTEWKKPQDENVFLGDISDIAVMVKTKELRKKKMPDCLEEAEYRKWMESFELTPKEIRGWRLSAAANIKDVQPVNQWIETLGAFLPKDEWKAVSFVEKLFEDGAAVPRLAFYQINGADRIFFKINRIEFYYAFYGEKERKITEKILGSIESSVGTRFCHMCLETNANLGTVTERQIVNYTGYSEDRTYIKNNLVQYHSLKMDYQIRINALGMNTVRKSWHYMAGMKTPDHEHILWYRAADVMSFYKEAADVNKKDIRALMKGNVYARYHKMC